MAVKALRALGHEAYPYAKYYQQHRWVEGRPALDQHDWDLILFMECNDGDPQYPELRITRARKTACWLFDTSYHQDRYRGLVNYFGFDHLFLANPLTIQEYKVWGYKNVHYLPYACDRELHGRSVEHPKTRDVVLVGSIRDDRIALARDLSRHGVYLELVHGVFREAYIDALASARIVVNQNPTQGRGLLNMRFFEAQAAGCYVLTEKEDYDVNVEAGMRHGALMGYYSSVPELAEKCKEALSRKGRIRPEESGIQEAATLYGWNVVVHDSYESRCQSLLHTIFPHETTTDYFAYERQ